MHWGRRSMNSLKKVSSIVLSVSLVLSLVLSAIPIYASAAAEELEIGVRVDQVYDADVVLAVGESNQDVTTFKEDLQTELEERGLSQRQIRIDSVEAQEVNVLQGSFALNLFWSNTGDDLDSHLKFMDANHNVLEHLYYNNLQVPGGSLDVDDVDGGVGEWLTIAFDEIAPEVETLLVQIHGWSVNGSVSASMKLYKESGDCALPGSLTQDCQLLINSPENVGDGEWVDFGEFRRNGYTWDFHFRNGDVFSGQEVQIQSRDFLEVIREPDWRSSAKHFLVNLNDETLDDLDDAAALGEIMTRMDQEQLHYIGWGSDTDAAGTEDRTQNQADTFIERNMDRGTFVNRQGTSYSQQIDQIADYIVSQMTGTSDVDMLTLGNAYELSVSPESAKTDTKDSNWPEGKWKIVHDPAVYEHNQGLVAYSGYDLDDLIVAFNKVGKYDIYYKDELVKTLYVHRQPVSLFTLDVDELGQVTYEDSSYDLDAQSVTDGLAAKEWQWKRTTDMDWTSGQPTTFAENGDYLVQLRVEDHQGASSIVRSRYQSTQAAPVQPIAAFQLSQTQLTWPDHEVEVLDLSYDPQSKALTSREWKVYQDDTEIYSGHDPMADFAAHGAGKYKLSLRVQNEALIWSEWFSRYVTIEPNTAPEISGVPDTSLYSGQQKIVHFRVGDAESTAYGVAVTAVSSNTELLPTANIVLNGAGPDRTVSVIADPDTSGEAIVTLIATDGDQTAQTSFAVEIVNSDDAASTGFVETEANNGSVAGVQKVAVLGETLVEPLHPSYIHINNLPEGLDFNAIRLHDTELLIQLTGKAINHSSEFSIDHLSVTVGKENFVGTASDLTSQTFALTFLDPAVMTLDKGVVTENVYGDAQFSEQVQLTIHNGKFAGGIGTDDIIVYQLPAGLHATITDISDTVLQIGFTGTATVTEDVYGASITVMADRIVGSSIPLVTNTFKFDFWDREPYLVVHTPVIEESARNDGSMEDVLIFELVNGTFDSSVADLEHFTVGWPEGLHIGELVLISPTQIQVSIAGRAENHEMADSVNHAQVAIGGIPSNTFAIRFRSPQPFITVSPDALADAGEGRVTDRLTVSLKNGTFVQDVDGGVMVNNLPEGLGFNVVRMSDTELEIQFTGQAIRQHAASTFSSVTIAAGFVTGTVSSLTSNTFDLQAPQDVSLVQLDVDELRWDTIREDNIMQASVTSNVYLPGSGIYGSQITWTSSDETVISTDGTVVRPDYEADDREVVLTAGIQYGTAAETKSFVLTVKKLGGTDEQLVADDQAALTWDTIREANIRQDNVTSHLVLPTVGEFGSDMSWTSSDTSIVDTNGNVMRPEYAEGDQEVILTATIAKGGISVTQQFVIRVKATQLDVNKQLDEVIGLLDIGYAEADSADRVTQDIELISIGYYDTEVTWTSHRTDIISHAGEVTRPQKDTVVRLTARVSKQGYFRQVDFYVTVKGTSAIDLPQDELEVEIGYAPGDGEDAVRKNLFLIKTGKTGSNIVWTSSHPAIVSNTGRVNRPGPDETDVTVVLTATLVDPDHPADTRTKTFTVTVKRLSDQEAVDEAARSLKIDDAASFVSGDIWESVTEGFLLLQQGKYDAAITWQSSLPSVIRIHEDETEARGTVTRQAQEQRVILTATFTRNGKTAVKPYLLIVKEQGVAKEGGIRQVTARQAQMRTANDGHALYQHTAILRTEMSDGIQIDTIIIDEDDLYQLIESINPNDPDDANRIITITHVDDPAVPADEIAVEIPAIAVEMIAGRNISLVITSDLAVIYLDEASVKQLEVMGTDLYFRVVPVRNSAEQQQLQTNAIVKGSAILSLSSSKTLQLHGEPREIETNYHGVNTLIRIPLVADQIPVDSAAARDAYLDRLYVYVEHSDGDVAVYEPLRIVYTDGGDPESIEFQIDKFSSFQIVQLTDRVSSGSGGAGPVWDDRDEEEILNGTRLKELQEEDENIEVTTDSGTIKLPADNLDLEDILTQFEPLDVDPQHLVIKAVMTEADSSLADAFKRAAARERVDVVGTLVQTSIHARYEDQSRAILSNGLITYTLPIPEGMKITTGVLYKDGHIYHQPTYVFVKNGQYFARINSFETGVFGLIWNPQQFADVDTHWSQQDVNDMGSRLVVKGVSAMSYEPERLITRAEFTAIIVRALGLVRHENVELPFSDVAAGEWYEEELAIAIDNGLVMGYLDGTFKPGNPITRQEAMVIVSRMMNKTTWNPTLGDAQYAELLENFVDRDSIANWAQAAVKMNLSAGIIVGRDGRLALIEDITRAETAAVVRRLLIQSRLINP